MAKVPVQINDSFLDVWRRISPEEKLEMMAKAQSKGFFAGVVLLSICGTIALGLRIPWIFWSSFIGIPFVFQFASVRAWRTIKPRAMLEYLAARSAARRYAFSAHCKDLALQLMFKGHLIKEYDKAHEIEKLEARIEEIIESEVWIALFRDTVVMISERQGGAKLDFVHAIDDQLTIEARGFEDGAGQEKFLSITIYTKNGDEHKFRLTSKYPAALLVFERKVRFFLSEMKTKLEKDVKAYRDMFSNFETVGGNYSR